MTNLLNFHISPAMDQPPPVETPWLRRFGLKQMLVWVFWWSVVMSLFAAGNVMYGLASLFVSTFVHAICTRSSWSIGVTLVALSGLLLVPPVQIAREAARKSVCNSELCQLSLALHAYHDIHGSFPPAYIADDSGKPIHSWRVLILPYLDEDALYRRYNFDEPWNGPNNSKLAAERPFLFGCPSNDESETGLETSYLAVVGPETAWPGPKGSQLSELAAGGRRILLVEQKGLGIHWMEPRDLAIDDLPMQINAVGGRGIASAHPGGAHVAFTDAQREFLHDSIESDELRRLLVGNPSEVEDARGSLP